MFQNLNKPAFGTAGTNAYLSGFGATNQNPFGQAQPFGKPATTGFGNTPSAFGQPAASLFGSQPQHGTNLFGSNANTATFGQTPTTQSTFGSTLFGAPAQQSASGLFGTNTATTSFGQQNKSGFGFGTGSPSSVFGSPQTNPQATASLFNPSASTSNVFGAGATTAFGANMNCPAGTVIKFTHVTGTDTMQKSGLTQTISTRHHCITCMKEYEGKSFEELRWEDYQADRKGPQQNTFGGSPFGATPTSAAPSLFGAPENKSVFGATSGFTPTNSFGASPPQPQGSAGLFGKPVNTFGTTTTNATPFAYNTATASNPFGNTMNKPFGSVASTPPLFGGATQTPNTFGTSFGLLNQNSGIFKPTQPNTFGGGLGAANAFPGFSAPASQGNTNLFPAQKTATSGGLFGQAPAQHTPFGTPNFNQPNANPFGGFNKPAAPLFGGAATNNGLNTNNSLVQNNSIFGPKPNLFGNNANTGLFGNTNTFGTGNNFNFNVPQNQPMNGPEQTSLNALLQLGGSPFGICNHLSGLSPPNKNHDVNRTTNPSELRTLVDTTFQNNKKTSPNSNKIKVTPMIGRKNCLFEGLEEGAVNLESPGYKVKGSAKRLVIRDKLKFAFSETGASMSDVSMNGVSINGSATNSEDKIKGGPKIRNSPMQNILFKDNRSSPRVDLEPNLFNDRFVPSDKISSPVSSPSSNNVIFTDRSESTPRSIALELDTLVEEPATSNNSGRESGAGDTQTVIVSVEPSQSPAGAKTQQTSLQNSEPHPTGIVLQRPEYYTVPPLDELHKYLTEDGTCIVNGFTIGRIGYGNVYFLDPIDIRNLNIDELVHFHHKELTIYPDDSKKPPLGEGLNRRAQVTLDRIWPRDKIDGTPITAPDRLLAMDYAGILKRISEKHNSRFVEYRPETGSWVFKVEHFSKYGLSDSDEDDPSAAAAKDAAALKLKMPQPNQTQPKQHPKAHKSMDVDVEKENVDEELLGATKFVTGFNTTDADYLFQEMDLLQQANMSKYSFQDDLEYLHSVSTMKASFFQHHPEQQQKERFDIVSVSTSDTSSCDMAEILHVSAMVDNMEAAYEDDADNDLSDFGDDCVSDRFAPECKQLLLNGGICPQANSICTSRNYVDMSIFKRRSYKVGWGPGNSLLTLVTKNASEETSNSWTEGRHKSDFSMQMVQHVKINKLSQLDHDSFENTLDAHMQVQLENSVVQVKNNVATFEVALKPEIVDKHHKITKEQSLKGINLNCEQIQYNSLIMELLIAFWGPADPNSDVDIVTEKREKFSDWLEKAVNQSVRENLNIRSCLTQTEVLDNLLTYLSGHQIANATNLALAKSMNRLSSLISQVNSSQYVRSLLQTQIQQWEKQNATNHMDETMIKLYLLCSGKPVLGSVNVCEDMDWKRALALHFWYICPLNAPLTTAVLQYEDAYKISNYAARPSPLNRALSHEQDIDIAFHLMKLYNDNTHPMNVTLNYSTHTDDPLDYRFSWILQQVLKSLGVGYVSMTSERFSHVSFASQLENFGLWKWAVFVLSFLKDCHIKKHCICHVLQRNIPIEITTENRKIENFLIYNLMVPPQWIHEAKGIKSLHTMQHWDAVKYFTLMEDFQLAHQIAYNHLIPSLIINEQYDILLKILLPLSDANRQIHDWDYQGGLILNFVELHQEFQRVDIRKELHRIQAALSSICRRVQFFKRDTARHQLCVAELSKHIAALVQEWFKAHVHQDRNLYQTAKQYIQQLIMPSGYRELGFIL